MTDEQALALTRRIVEADKLKFRIGLTLYGLGIAYFTFMVTLWLLKL